MSVPRAGWCFFGPQGASATAYPSAREAAEAALARALATRWDPRLDAETKRRLWRSLQTKGWIVKEVAW